MGGRLPLPLRVRWTKLAALSVSGFLGACVPTVAHGPEVEAGLSPSLTIAPPLSIRRYDQGSSPFVISPALVNISYGWRWTEDAPAVQVNAGVSMIFQVQPDIYLQLPRPMLLGLQGGVGVTALAPAFGTSPMPYAELGRIAYGNGPYLIAGYVHQPVSATSVEDPVVLHADGLSITAAYQFLTRRASNRVFLTALLGHRFASDCAGSGVSCTGLPRARAIFVGLTRELSRR